MKKRNKNLATFENFKIVNEMLQSMGVNTDEMPWTVVADISNDITRVVDLHLEGDGCIVRSK